MCDCVLLGIFPLMLAVSLCCSILYMGGLCILYLLFFNTLWSMSECVHLLLYQSLLKTVTLAHR